MPQEVLQYEQTIDFGQGAVPVDVTMSDPPGGPYQVQILASKQVTNDKSGKTSNQVDVTIIEEGPAKGMTTRLFLGTDYSKPFNVGHVANLLLGCGVPRTALVGRVTLRPDMIKGRKCFIFVREPMDGEVDEETGRPARANKNFITKEQYDQLRSAAALAGGAPAAPRAAAPAASTGTPPAAPAATGGAVDLAGMFPPG
jgi:hypothetical protein